MFYVEAAGVSKALAAGGSKPSVYCGIGKHLMERENDPCVFFFFFLFCYFPPASSLTQRRVVESLMLPVVPQTTSYKPLLTSAEGSTPGVLKSNRYLHVSVRNQGSSQLKIPPHHGPKRAIQRTKSVQHNSRLNSLRHYRHPVPVSPAVCLLYL